MHGIPKRKLMLLFLLKIRRRKRLNVTNLAVLIRNKCPEFKKAAKVEENNLIGMVDLIDETELAERHEANMTVHSCEQNDHVEELKSNEEFTVEKVSCNVLEDKDGSANRDEFLIDSGATTHVVNDKKWLCNIEACNIYLTSIDSGNFYKTRGDVYLSNGVVLKQVVLATSLPRNIISVSRLNNDKNLKATFTHKGCQVTKNDKIVISAELRNMLYFAKFTFTIKEEVHSMIDLDDNYIFNKEDEEDDWLQKHRELGHASENQMKTLGIKNPNGTKCFTCMSMVNKTKGGTDNHDYDVGELIHTDLVGPMYNEYAIVSVDHKSKVIFSYILQSKNEASDKAIATIKTFNNLLKQQDKSICYIRSDNEFNTRKLNDYCQ